MLYLLIAVLAAGADQLFKYYIVQNLSSGVQTSLVPGVVHLTYLENDGAAFSSFAGMRWILSGISLVCAVVLIVVLLRSKIGVFGKLMLAFILGGAVGNLIDRVLYGYVVDMFEVEFMNFAVFNVADIFITVGCVLFVIYYLVSAPGQKKKAKKAVPSPAAEKQPEAGDAPMTAEEILSEYSLEHLLDDENDGNADSQG